MSTPELSYAGVPLREPVHFIGIGGVGMSGVARVMVARGVRVSGSDAKELPVMRELETQGAHIEVGYAEEHLGEAGTVVAGSAIRADNPELMAAREAEVPVLHRSQALAALMGGDRVVTVAGTHGKTTTTSMITVLLKGIGLDPSFAIGAAVPALGVNAASGTDDIFVAEADESDGSFLNYAPKIAVVTNVEADHLDYYGTADAVFQAFDDFAALLPADGLLVVCADDDGAAALAERVAARGRTRVLRYGAADKAELRLLGTVEEPSVRIGEQEFPLRLAVPGRHNQLNALAALGVALELGVNAEDALGALAAFQGAARRFELKGEERGVRVYDDYAHHPTEVRAALSAARSVAGEHRLHVLFQPHLFSRTREFAQEFAESLKLADTAVVLDIYPAREDPIEGVTSELITAHLGSMPSQPGRPALDALLRTAEAGDVVLTVGAGDVTAYGQQILDALRAGAHG
ncbi:UDP-N-acetylmuramate--L-alanine ligase [Arthrobacter sp. NPDC090010]|uniref:UDP-N-acetylmuramate--L-alanine ligase n=1 Tax=Arthrobacter sp. NPDC090010 TaxID=3363942 RepID=UPI00381203A5